MAEVKYVGLHQEEKREVVVVDESEELGNDPRPEILLIKMPDDSLATVSLGDVLKTTEQHAEQLCESGSWKRVDKKEEKKGADS